MPPPVTRRSDQLPTEGISRLFNQASGHSFLDRISTFINELKADIPQGASMNDMLKAFMDNIGNILNNGQDSAPNNPSPDARPAVTVSPPAAAL